MKINIDPVLFWAVYNQNKKKLKIEIGGEYSQRIKYLIDNWKKYSDIPAKYKYDKATNKRRLKIKRKRHKEWKGSPDRIETIRKVEDIMKLDDSRQYEIYDLLYKKFDGVNPKDWKRKQIKKLFDTL